MNHLSCSHTCHALGPLPYSVPTLLWRSLLLGLHPSHSGTGHTAHIGWLCVLLGWLLSPLPLGRCASTDVDLSAPHSLSNTLSLHGFLACFLSVSLWCKCVFCAASWAGLICHLAQPISTSPWTVVPVWQAVRANACAYCKGPTPMPRTVFRALQLNPSSPSASLASQLADPTQAPAPVSVS